MKKVKFKFDVDEAIRTNFEVDGIIEMCAFDSEGITYYVKTKNNSGWYKEKFLSKIKPKSA